MKILKIETAEMWGRNSTGRQATFYFSDKEIIESINNKIRLCDWSSEAQVKLLMESAILEDAQDEYDWCKANQPDEKYLPIEEDSYYTSRFSKDDIHFTWDTGGDYDDASAIEVSLTIVDSEDEYQRELNKLNATFDKFK